MKIKFSLFILAILTFTMSALAEPRSSTVTLPGGTINPTETFVLSTNKLVPNGNYTVTCAIKDPNNAKNKVSLTVSHSVFYGYIYLNGKLLDSGLAQFTLPQVNNSLMIQAVSNGASVSITNLDQSDSVTVENCVANIAPRPGT